MRLDVPELSLILLVGPSGAGKSTFARAHFGGYEVVSSDHCRALVSNDENSAEATPDAFDLLRYLVAKRLERGLLTVVDATNVRRDDRKGLIELARRYHVLPAAIVLDLPRGVCESRNAARTDRQMPGHVVRRHQQALRKGLRGMRKEGFTKVHVLRSEEEVAAVTGIERTPLYSNRKDVHGPFDIIGDIHGCYDELLDLLTKLGYRVDGTTVTPPAGRTAVFVGDLVDRGPNSPDVLRLVMAMVGDGVAYCVPGNHDAKLQKALSGRKLKPKHGLAETLAQLEGETAEFRDAVRKFLYGLTSHYVFDDGKLVVAHAGIREDMQGRGSGAVRAFCLFGDTTGEKDEYGLPVRRDWAADYRGRARVVYGHTPVAKARWVNRTIDIDTGCVFGGRLTALRYPELKLVDVPARQMYWAPARPLDADERDADLLRASDVIGKQIVETELMGSVTLKPDFTSAALETISRFTLHPKWLIYLPPTMSPCATSDRDNYLEHPAEALAYYRERDVNRVICEEKHMGSRAVVIIGRNAKAIRERFGVTDGRAGICYTRTGRAFFTDRAVETAFIARLAESFTATGFWEEFATDWVCLDAELMPWSAKAQGLLREQYAAVGAAAEHALMPSVAALKAFGKRHPPSPGGSKGEGGAEKLLERYTTRQNLIERYRRAYRQYCWPVNGIDDLRLAPFHLLATEGKTYFDRNHQWHMETLQRHCTGDRALFQPTRYHVVDLADERQVADVVGWWMEMTEKGGEGMVVKPLDFVVRGDRGLLQPAVKCRGREYLRIIYGPDYDRPENLHRLRKRGLGRKRGLALREFALGVESLNRFVAEEPLHRVHEAVFGVLALESDPVDPRL